MADYMLRYVDNGTNMLCTQPIACRSDSEAIALVRELRLRGRSEIWAHDRLICTLGPRSKLLAETEA